MPLLQVTLESVSGTLNSLTKYDRPTYSDNLCSALWDITYFMVSFTMLYKNYQASTKLFVITQELNYCKQIACQLRTQYIRGNNSKPVTLKSGLKVTHAH